MPSGELDPAYFDQDEWERRDDGEDGTLYSEYYIHKETGQRVTPEKFHELIHNTTIVQNADVISRDKLRRLVDHLESRAHDKKETALDTRYDSTYGEGCGLQTAATDLRAVFNGEAFNGE